MDRKTLIARLRQLYAIDKNAFAIYAALLGVVEAIEQSKLIAAIAEDEKRHIVLDEEMISLLEK